MRVYYHLVLVLLKMLDEIGHPRVVFKARHHELLEKAVRNDILREW